MKDRVLVTGATGLIGAWLVRLWPDAGHELVTVGSADVDLLRPGAAADLVDNERPSAVVHLAWCASGDPGYRVSDDNEAWVLASTELVRAAQRVGARCWLTGTVVDDVPTAVATVLDPYTLSKVRLRQSFKAEIDSRELGWFQPTYVVDPDRGRPSLVAQAKVAAHSGEPMVLRTPTDRHDFVHAGDVAAAMVLAVSRELTGLLPIGSGRTRAVRDLAQALRAPWTSAQSTEMLTEQHSGAAADISWLSGMPWHPFRTNELFGADNDRKVGS